jgi:transposase InsO family protein
MGSVGDCYDNAMCESFFATLECELIDRSTIRSHDQARDAIIDFIEAFYNASPALSPRLPFICAVRASGGPA